MALRSANQLASSIAHSQPSARRPAESVSKCAARSPRCNKLFPGLRTGLLLAILAILLLLSANFQSLRLALAIVLTIPAVLCGVLLMLRITATTLNVQSFMGAIMSIGIAVANSILLVTFAERARHEGRDSLEAAREGASSRLRAILMTAAAMIFGMLPMAIGFAAGGSESAPLGRAVIGGLIVSTFTTLTVLPSIYAILQRKASIHSLILNPMDPRSRYHEAQLEVSSWSLPRVIAWGQGIGLVAVVSKPISRTIWTLPRRVPALFKSWPFTPKCAGMSSACSSIVAVW